MRLRTLFAIYLASTAAAICTPFAIHGLAMTRLRMMPVNSEAPLQAAPPQHPLMDPYQKSLMCSARDGAHYYKSTLSTGGVYMSEFGKEFIPDIVVQACAISWSGNLYLVGKTENQNWLRSYTPTAELRWSVERDENCSSPALSRDTIYLICMPRSGNTKLIAYDPEGQVRWIFEIGGFDWNPVPPAVGTDGTVYIYSAVQSSPEVIAISPDGQQRWSAPVPARANDPLPIRVNQLALSDDGTVVVSVPFGNVVAFSADGQQLWSFHSGQKVNNGGFVIGPDGTVYFAGGFLYALDGDGKPKWTFKSELTYIKGDYFDGDLAVGADGTVYARSYYNQLYAITRDGRKKWAVNETKPSLPGLTLGIDSLHTYMAWYSIKMGSGLAQHGWPSVDHNDRNDRSLEMP